MTREQLIKAVSHDWLERNGDHFVHIRTKNALEWEKNVGKDGSFADYLYGPQDTEDLIHNAVPYARNMIVAMNPDMKVNVRLSGSQDSYTDGTNVCLSTDMFDDKDIDKRQKLDIFLGHAIHEGAHLLYTDFPGMRNALTANPNPIFKTIFNIIEDEMIENTLGEDKRGLALFIMKVKDYLWGRYLKNGPCDRLSNDNTLAEIIDCTLGRIRYPSLLTEDLIVKHGRYLLKVTEVLTPFPKNTRESLEAARKITELIEKEYQHQKDQQKKQQQGQNQQDSQTSQQEQKQGNGNGTRQQNENDSRSGKNSGPDSDRKQEIEGKDTGGSPLEATDGRKDKDSKTNGDSDKKSDGKDGKTAENPDNGSEHSDSLQKDPAPGPGQQSGQTDVGENPDELKDMQKDYSDVKTDEKTMRELYEQFKKIQDNLSQLSHTPSPNGETDPAKSQVLNNSTIQQYCEGTIDKTNSYNFFSKKIKDNKTVYDHYTNEIRKYIYGVRNAVRLHLKEYQYVYKGMRSGRLDESKIVEAYIGSPCVYSQQGMSKCNRLNVCILLDESGSMKGQKLAAATKTAILLNESLKGLPGINLFIYGHKERYLTIYREIGHNQPWALGNTSAQGGTPTGKALLEIRRRIRRNTSEKTLVFLIGDGKPKESPQEMRPILTTLEKDNLPVVSISIDKSFQADAYYPRNINLINFDQSDALSELAPKLGAIIRDSVIKNTTRQNTTC